MRTLESALRDSADALRQGASRLPDRGWRPPKERHVARGIVIGLSTAVIVLVVFAVPVWLAPRTGDDLSIPAPPVAAPSEPSSGLADTDLVNPLLEFQSQGLSSDEFHNARQWALSGCMQERGWTFEPTLQESPVPEPRTVGELRELRNSYGYGLYTTGPGDPLTKRAADRNHEYYTTLDDDQQAEYLRDLNGGISGEGEVPVDGSCEALAEEAIDIPGTDQAVMTDMRTLHSSALQSPEYLRAVDDWRVCLAERGYEIDPDGHPVDLVDELALAEPPSEELEEFEVSVAVDDFECSLTTTMPIRHLLETEIVEELVEEYPNWESTPDTNVGGGR